jgi:uncharacterized membrane protein YgcG
MLFGSTALEVLIGMVFIYLLLSLLCSAVAEYIEAWRNVRAKNLRKGIELLLNDLDEAGVNIKQGTDLASRLYQHGLVRPLYRRAGQLPSYIPSRTFALALWNIATEKAGPGTTDLAKIRAVIDAVPNHELKQALETLIDDAQGNFAKARRNIEDWYEGAMDRVSGWYKRRVQMLLLAIGFVTAAAINADTINIAKVLIRDPALRSSVVAAAEAELEKPTTTAALAAAKAPPPPAAAAAAPAPTATPAPDAIAQIEAARENVRRAKAQLNELGLPLGWVGVERDAAGQITNRDDLRRRPADFNEWVLKFFGIFLTGLAISQGSPFWFDLLNKFMVIRSTVKPKEKSQEQPSKDKPAPETETGDDAGRGNGGGSNGGNGSNGGGSSAGGDDSSGGGSADGLDALPNGGADGEEPDDGAVG